jgi:hypothetical protein
MNLIKGGKKKKIKINKIIDEKMVLQQMLVKSRGSLGNILKTYTQINWKL